MSVIIPASGVAVPADAAPVVIDDFWPPLSVAECRRQTGMGDVWAGDRVLAMLQTAVAEVVVSVADWRAAQTAPTLADVACPQIGGIPASVIWFKTAVYARLRAQTCDRTRDYDSTKSGHGRADTLESTSDGWMQASNEAVARLTGRTRAVVELI